MERLIAGYRAFKAGRWPEERAHYEDLARKGQNPEYLVIACSDSRADPATIFSASPGELFVVRNVAGRLAPCEPDSRQRGARAAPPLARLALKTKTPNGVVQAPTGGVAPALHRH